MKEALLTIGIAAVAVGLLFGAAILKWDWNAGEMDEDLGPIESRPVVPYTPVAELERFHGLAVQLHNRNSLVYFKTSLREIAELGADTVMLSVAAYQENGSSSTIAIGAHNAPTKEEMGELIALGKSLGLRVIVMPIVLLDNPRGGEWRGKIVPTDPDRWWADYRQYIRYYAEPASQQNADLFMVGSELNKMETSTSRWRTLIAFMRKNYPNLKLGYSANWDRYWKVRYWKELDYAGVTSYYELAPEPDYKRYVPPPVDEIANAWVEYRTSDWATHHYRDKLIAWQRTIGKPIIFTEIGYFSKQGTAWEPWNYCMETPRSEEEQANCYEAFVQVWNDRRTAGEGIRQRSPWGIVGGLLFWEWTNGPGGKEDDGYTPKGKLAEQILRNYFRSLRPEQPAATTQPAAGQPATQPAATGPN